jgi:hypothetical protein
MTTTISDHAVNVAVQLAAAGIGLTRGTNLYNGPMRAQDAEGVPSEAVFCHVTGGVPPIDYCDNSHTPQLHQPSVQIMIRSAPRGYDAGLALANDVYEAMHSKPPSGYFGCLAQQSAPLYAGETRNGEFLWTVNLTLYLDET